MSKGSGATRNYSPYQRAKQKVIAVNTGGQNVSQYVTQADIEKTASSISSMAHRDMEKEINQAISRYAAVLGIPEKNIKLADVPGAYGVTFFDQNGSKGIYLDRKTFDVSKKEFEENYKKSNYARREGFKNVTRKPAQHTVTHELAHSTWNSGFTAPKYAAAGREIKRLYADWMKDTSTARKKNYGSYGKKNVDEFWAEVVTRAIHGDSDKYTRRALGIAKKHIL